MDSSVEPVHLEQEHTKEALALHFQVPRIEPPRAAPQKDMEVIMAGALENLSGVVVAQISGVVHEMLFDVMKSLDKIACSMEKPESFHQDKAGVENIIFQNVSRRHRLQYMNEVSSSEDEPRDPESVGQCSISETNGGSHTLRKNRYNAKLPPFTGKDSWDVWINRFHDIADRQGWNDDAKLDEILPNLQGTAGEFVFGQLPRKIRSNFKDMVKELGNRFWRVETAKAFISMFSNRQQKPSESVEDFAADLKCLYDKAYAERDAQTRTEDLLRRFFDGLMDDKSRFHVEYIKDPSDIDEAVYEVVHFLSTQRPSGERDQQNQQGLFQGN